MITKEDINECFAKSFEEMNKAVQQYVAEDMMVWATKTPEEYEAWNKDREAKRAHKEGLERCRRTIADLKESLAFEERSLQYYLDHTKV